MIVRNASISDITSCVALAGAVKDDFPGYKEEAFRSALEGCISDGTAVLAEEGAVVGLLLFSREEKELQFLAVHARARKRGVAKKLIGRMLPSFQSGDEIQVVTFQEGDPKGTAARACYHACGFQDGALLEVFHYPCQKMIYRVP